MNCSAKVCAALIAVFLGGKAEGRDPQTSQLRFQSMTMRDIPPSTEEAKAVADGKKNVEEMAQEWLDSSEHEKRVKRFFDDRFGANPSGIIVSLGTLLLDYQDGVYVSNNKGGLAGCPNVVQAQPWWLEGQSVSVCSNLISDKVFALDADQKTIACISPNFIKPECGCGKRLHLCTPKNILGGLSTSVIEEISTRALHTYKNDQTWNQFVAGPEYLIANRFLYKRYIELDIILSKFEEPTDEHIETLISLPMDEFVPVGRPDPELGRAGIATASVFIQRFNNFRSRIAALTEKLLCQDVDSSLNLDGLDQFKNSDFTDFDRYHGQDPQCSGCHYPMDNMGSTIFGWGEQGQLGFKVDGDRYSQLGHAFGNEGTGAEFLQNAYVDLAPNFHQCMTQTVWEDFSGFKWGDLTSEQQGAFMDLSRQGPKALIQGILLSKPMLHSRLTGLEVTAAGPDLEFETTINPILSESCNGGGCHGSDAAIPFVDNADRFRKASQERLTDGSMPPPGSGRSLSDADRDLLAKFLTGDP